VAAARWGRFQEVALARLMFQLAVVVLHCRASSAAVFVVYVVGGNECENPTAIHIDV